MKIGGLNTVEEAAEVVVRIRNIVGKIDIRVVVREFVFEIESVEVEEIALREESAIGLAVDVLSTSCPPRFLGVHADPHPLVVHPPGLAVVHDGELVPARVSVSHLEVKPVRISKGIDVIVQKEGVELVRVGSHRQVARLEAGVEAQVRRDEVMEWPGGLHVGDVVSVLEIS